MLAHPECPALPEVEAVRGNKVFRSHTRLGNVFPRKAERLPAAGVHLAVKHRQPIPAIQHLTGNTQPGQITDHIGLHTLQPGLCLGYAISG